MSATSKTWNLEQPIDLWTLWKVFGVVRPNFLELPIKVSGSLDPGTYGQTDGASRLSRRTMRSALEPFRMGRQKEKGEQQQEQINTPDKLVNVLVDIPLFDGLDGEELQAIVKYMNHIEVEPGEYIFKEGDKGTYMCFAAEGVFDVLKKPVKGKSLPICCLRKGQSIGEMSVIDSYPRSATVRARTKGALVTLTRSSFESILEKHPAIGLRLFRKLSRMMSLHLRKTSSGFADQLFLLHQEDMV
jgi:CRP/FNR family cyclic AMP-dependent transcriptional regulator